VKKKKRFELCIIALAVSVKREKEGKREKEAINIVSNLDGSICVMFETSSRDTIRRSINLPAKLSAGNCDSVLTFPKTVSSVQCESFLWD